MEAFLSSLLASAALIVAEIALRELFHRLGWRTVRAV
jgi:hypothetical protein